MRKLPDFAQLANLPLIETMYARYLENPELVESSWRYFFEGMDLGGQLPQGDGKTGGALRVQRMVQAYRRYGHLGVPMNPIVPPPEEPVELSLNELGFRTGELEDHFPTLGFCPSETAPLKEIRAALQRVYCSSIGFEYMDLDSKRLEEWIQKQIEPVLTIQPTIEEKRRILEHLNRSEVLETFLHTKYVGQKRFSVEGVETLIPILAELIAVGGEQGIEHVVIGMAHRGRLNVLANILNKPYAALFQEFEDNVPLSSEESGDVKYHKGFSGKQEQVHVHLAANSSCLESVDPIVLGHARALQVQTGDEARKKVGAILIHGDAAIAGQGVVYETMQFVKLPGYATGGTIHIVVNNQIGFTTSPPDGRSTRYPTDIAKTFGAPVFHVNAEDPESCIFAARLSLAIRLLFQCDVFIDLNGYRKYGHNEGDEPAFTQPAEYKQIRAKRPIREIYTEKLAHEGSVEKALADQLTEEFKQTLSQALAMAKMPTLAEIRPTRRIFPSPKTAVDRSIISQVAKIATHLPENFAIHPKLQKLIEERRAMAEGKIALDWGMAETLAFGTLLVKESVAIRLAGQDSIRGTFSHRHASFFDQNTNQPYCPLAHVDKARFDVYNSPLSEYGALGFEFGYSMAATNALVIWEAQYGDFVIGAEITIDHYLTAAEQKWGSSSNLTLLLPHGYEGGGPEHSSARIERFLELAAGSNIRVAAPTSPAQYFHLLRRQALWAEKKPLIVFTPKSLLRSELNMSSIDACVSGAFEELITDQSSDATRLVLTFGKLGLELIKVKEKLNNTACVRIEQVYPFPTDALKQVLAQHPRCAECIWAQEEPENMGAWPMVSKLLPQILPPTVKLRYIGRKASASTATGSLKRHNQEQEEILRRLK
ncbi:MAG: hypothetical protein RL235_952 [Chlamydiota bacterium]